MAIYCIIGKTGAGKDTLMRNLLRRADVRPLQMCTTRPRRFGEESGHHFRTWEESESDIKSGRAYAVREHKTNLGVWRYYVLPPEHIDLMENDFLINGSATFLESLINTEIQMKVPIYAMLMDVEQGVRLERLLHREKDSCRPDYIEMCRRFLSDERDFEIIPKSWYELHLDNTQGIEPCVEKALRFMAHKGVYVEGITEQVTR